MASPMVGGTQGKGSIGWGGWAAGMSIVWTLSSLSLGHQTFGKFLYPSVPHSHQYNKVLKPLLHADGVY